MTDDLTFGQLARLCIGFADSGPATLTRRDVQQMLRVGAAAASDVLIEAEDAHYVVQADGAWKLTERGIRLANAVTAAASDHARRSEQLITRPFTAWFPSGEEDLN